MKNRFFLLIASDLITDVKDADGFLTLDSAVDTFKRIALSMYQSEVIGWIHIAETAADVVECPDYMIRYTEDNGIECERT